MKHFLVVLFCSSFLFTNAQVDPKVVTSPIYKHKKPRIYMEEMLGEVDNIVYMLYSTMPVKASTLPSLTIKMYDKEDMHLIKSKELIPDNPNLQKKYKDFTLYDYVITKKKILFFFKDIGKKGARTIYLGTYDLNLNQKKTFTKVLSYNSRERKFVGLANGTYPNILLTTMNYASEGEKLFIEYKELDKDFKLVKSGKVDMPFKPTFGKKKLFGSNKQAFANRLYLSDAGQIVTSINIEAEEVMTTKKSGKRKKDRFADASYKSIIVIEPKNEKILEVPVKLDDRKNVGDFNWYADGNDVLVTGFYADRDLEKRGNELHGVFYMRVNVPKAKTELVKTTKFPEDFLYRINSQNTLISKRRRKKETDNESINEVFQISKVISNSATKEITVYCEPIHNYVVTTTDQNGNTQTTYHSDRGSLFYFKISENGEFEYFNSIRKKTKWSSGSSAIWYRESVFIHRAHDGLKDYVMFATQRIYNERDKADLRGEKAKWKKAKRDFVIASVSNKTGNFDLNYPQVYDKKDKKNYGTLIDNIIESNGNLYSYGIERKMRLSRIITAILTIPTIYVPYAIIVSPKSYYQKVQLNRLEIQE